jgi:lysine-N-methylase
MYLFTDIVQQFSCELCGRCCRNKWLVTIDNDTYRKTAKWFAARGKEAEFSEAFKVIRDTKCPGEYAYIAKKPNGECWFLHDNFCRIHRYGGHDMLDSVCQTFPRYPVNTARGVEITLSLSCPAVLRAIDRIAPLTIIRSDNQPTALGANCYVAEVFPQQRAGSDPLRYYFELEHHFIDLMQCRGLSIAERLALIAKTASDLSELDKDSSLGEQLNFVFARNYSVLDSLDVKREEQQEVTPAILIEHFFVNLIFKKIFFRYGLERAVILMKAIWNQLEPVLSGAGTAQGKLTQTRKLIIALETKYNHDREELNKLWA